VFERRTHQSPTKRFHQKRVVDLQNHSVDHNASKQTRAWYEEHLQGS
jgi:hypothetical protein